MSTSDLAAVAPDSPVAAGERAAAAAEPADPLAASRRLLLAVRRGESVEESLGALSALDERALAETGADERLALWLNCYNAAAQLLAAARPALYDSRRRFFSVPALSVAGERLSLDDIEHGLVRGRSKYGLGYLPRVRPSAFERRHRVERLDPRIHFALNCAAASCPAIAAYSAAVDRELADATAAYLEATVAYDPDAGLFGRGVVRVPRVCLWFRGDFGGPSGVRTLLCEHGLIGADERPRVAYLGWDWSRRVGRFRGPEPENP